MSVRGGPPGPAPAVCLATGGSGTRSVAAVFEAAGFYIGPHLNDALDALTLKPFLRRWPEDYVRRTRWVDTMATDPSGSLAAPMAETVADLEHAIARTRDGIPALSHRWGWKAPRTIFVLPLVDQLLPQVRTVQLVRDGRDMAYSSNQAQLKAMGHVVVPDLAGRPEPVRSAAMWSRMNVAAATYGAEHMGGRHLVVRYEDLCSDPRSTVALILDHIGADASTAQLDDAAALVKPPTSLGRWRQRDRAGIEPVAQACATGLARFGYLSSSTGVVDEGAPGVPGPARG